MTFEPGDVVKLKSGGIEMTVQNINNADQVVCVWQDRSGTHRETFSAVLLKKWERSGPGIMVI